MACLSTARVIAASGTSATEGRVAWSAARSLWAGGMTLAAIGLAPFATTPGAVLVFLGTSAATLCLGHSLGLHRMLIHRSFRAHRWLARAMIYLGTLVGMAGPLGMVRLHDTRDWAQRQAECHDFHAHRAGFLRDAWWQMHCRLVLAMPPDFVLEAELAEDGFLRWLERSWMAQQLPLAVLLYVLGGLPWLVWGVPVRIAVCLSGHWLVGHATHRRGPQGWHVEGVAVQGHDLPGAALVTFGEAWHGNHHAWPESARLGIEPGQHDPGWWVLVALRRIGLVWQVREPGDLVPREGLRRAEPVSLPDDDGRDISWWRVVAGFVLAPLVAAFAMACAMTLEVGLANLPERVVGLALPIAVIGAYPPAIVVGIPAFLIVRRFTRPKAWNCALAGALIASLSWLMVIPALGMLLFGIAGFGALGGTVFWLVVGGVRAQHRGRAAPRRAPPPGRTRQAGPTSRREAARL